MIDLIFPRVRHRFRETDRLHVLIVADLERGRAAERRATPVTEIQVGDLIAFLGRVQAVERVG